MPCATSGYSAHGHPHAGHGRPRSHPAHRRRRQHRRPRADRDNVRGGRTRLRRAARRGKRFRPQGHPTGGPAQRHPRRRRRRGTADSTGDDPTGGGIRTPYVRAENPGDRTGGPRRPDRARTRGARPGGGRQVERGNRRPLHRQPQHGQDPREPAAVQTVGPLPGATCRMRLRVRFGWYPRDDNSSSGCVQSRDQLTGKGVPGDSQPAYTPTRSHAARPLRSGATTRWRPGRRGSPSCCPASPPGR